VLLYEACIDNEQDTVRKAGAYTILIGSSLSWDINSSECATRMHAHGGKFRFIRKTENYFLFSKLPDVRSRELMHIISLWLK